MIMLAPALAQDGLIDSEPDQEETVEEQIPAQYLNHSDDRIITLSIENDSIGGDSDRHYTSGVRLSYFDMNIDFPEFSHQIADLIPTFDINDTTSLIYTIGQNLYTPSDITKTGWDDKDRPWAGFTYVALGMASLSGNHVDEVEATLGIVGPWALGEQSQKSIHKLMNATTPKGWDNQLSNEPGLFVSWQRRWLERFHVDKYGLFFSADPFLGATVGNVYTYANTGLSFRFGPQSVRWEDMPLRVRPAMPGTGYYNKPVDRLWNWHIFGGLEGRALARNIFLDGNSFQDSPRVDKKYFVADANLGLALTLGPARLNYTLAWRSEEFQGQEEPDVFGSLGLSFRF